MSTAANTTYTDPDHANTPYLISAGWAAGEPTYHRTHLTITDNLGLGVMHEGQYPQSGAPAWPTTQYGPIPQSDCPQDAVDTTDDICHTDCVAIEDANYYTISNNQFYSCQSQGLFLEFDSVGGAGGNGTIVNNYIDSTNACGICIGGYANNALFGTNLIAFNTVNTGVGVTSCNTYSQQPGTTFNFVGNYAPLGMQYCGNTGSCSEPLPNVTSTFNYNVFLGTDPSSVADCNALGTGNIVSGSNSLQVKNLDDLASSPPDLTTNYDLSGSPGSLPFENIVPASVCASITAVDVHGDPRPATPGGNCDPGADER